MPVSSSNKDSLAFNEFLSYLRGQGFKIGIDSYLRLQELLNKLSQCSPHELKTLLCPIFATDQQQQEKFHLAFDDFFTLFNLAEQHPATIQSAEKARDSFGDLEDDHAFEESSRSATLNFETALLVLGTLLVGIIIYLTPLSNLNKTSQKVVAPTQITLPTLEIEQSPNVKFPIKTNNRNSKGQADGAEELSPLEESPIETDALTAPTPLSSTAPLAGSIYEESFYRRYKWYILWAIILSPYLFFAVYEFHRYRERKLFLQRRRVRRPPFVWPIRVEPHTVNSYPTESLQQAARLMRKRERDEFYRFDVSATVASTIEGLGYPTLRYEPASKPPEYLILIDRASFRDHQASLFNEYAIVLEGEGNFVKRYFFDSDPRICCGERGEECLHLAELQNKHSTHRLLLFGDGGGMIDPVSGRLAAWVNMFTTWQKRAVLTPKPPARWGLQELSLTTEFLLVPSTIEGLQALVEQFETTGINELRSRLSVSPEPAVSIDLDQLKGQEMVSMLRSHLGEDVFQWVCACAVYPELQWNLTLHLGSLPVMSKNLVTQENLLKLSRLPWFRAGAMSEETRWYLIRELDPEKEKSVRATIIELLERHPPARNSFAAETYEINLAIQRWLLYRDWKMRRRVARRLKTAPRNRIVQDYTLLRFLDASPDRLLAIVLPTRLRHLFYHQGIPAFGLRSIARLAFVLLISVMIWWSLTPARDPHDSNDEQLAWQLTQEIKNHSGTVSFLSFSDDGHFLASSGNDKKVSIWDIKAGKESYSYQVESDFFSTAFSPDGHYLAIGGTDFLLLWDSEKGQMQRLSETGSNVLSLAFSPDGKTLACGVFGRIDLWDLASRQVRQNLKGVEEMCKSCTSITFSPDSKTLAASSTFGNKITLWDVASGNNIDILRSGGNDNITSLNYSPDGRTLILGNTDGSVILLDQLGTAPKKLQLYKWYVKDVIYSPNGHLLTGASNSMGGVILYNFQTLKPSRMPTLQIAPVFSTTFARTGGMFATGGNDGTIFLWSIQERDNPPLAAGAQTEQQSAPSANTLSVKRVALVRLTSTGNVVWINKDGVIISGNVYEDSTNPPFLRGWDDSNTESARVQNRKLLQFYLEMKRGWDESQITGRIAEVDLSDLQDVRVQLSGDDAPIEVRLGDHDFTTRMSRALKVLEEQRNTKLGPFITYLVVDDNKVMTGYSVAK